MSGVLAYLPLIVLAVVTLLIYVWYLADISRRKAAGVAGNPLTHPLRLLSDGWRALWHEQNLLFLLFVLWVSGATGSWVRAFWRLRPDLREDRHFGLIWFDPSTILQAFQQAFSRWSGLEAALQSVPRQTMPLPSGQEAVLVSAVLILIALGVAAFVGVVPAGKKTRRGLYVMLAIGLLSVLLWAAIPYIASAAQAAQQRPPVWFAAVLMVVTLALQAPLAALLGSFSLAALYQIIARGGWSWRQTASRAAAAFLPMMWVQIVVFVSLSVIGAVAAALLPAREAAESLPSVVLVQRGLSVVTYAAAVLLLFCGWAIVVEGLSWTRGVRRNLSLIARNIGPVVVFVLRASALIVPLSLLNLAVGACFSGSLAGRFAASVVVGVANTALLLMAGGAFLRLREAEAGSTPAATAKESVPEGAPAA